MNVSVLDIKAATFAPFWSPSCLCSFKTEGKMEYDDGHRRSFLLPVFLSFGLAVLEYVVWGGSDLYGGNISFKVKEWEKKGNLGRNGRWTGLWNEIISRT